MPKAKEPKQVETALDKTSFIKLELNKLATIKKELGTNEQQVAFVKKMINQSLTDVELMVFLSFSNKLELNPFLGEIIPIVYGANSKDRKVSYIITRNGKRVVAGRTGELGGITSETIYVSGGNQVQPWTEGATIFGATATVKRNGVDYTATVLFKEYNTGMNVWKTKPDTMIRKVAESQALSAAFPEVLGSTYDEAEAGSMVNENVQLAVPNGNEPASQEQIDTLTEMGYTSGELTDLTKGDAVKMLTSKKGKTNGQ